MRSRMARSGIALGIGTGFEGVMRFLRSMIVAKLLLPQEVGLIALLLATTQIFESMTEVGINFSVIQNKKGDREDFLNMAWWFQCCRGIGLYGIGYALAPLLANFFDDPRMIWMLRVSFLMVPLKSLMSPRTYLLEKNLKYVQYMILYQGSILFSMVLLVSLLLFWKNAWAWVIGFVVEYLLFFLLSYVMCPFLPKFAFHRESFSEIVHFARGMLGLPLLVFVAYQLDIFVLGKTAPRDLVGLYSMAVVLARIPRELFMKTMGRLMLPVFSHYQENINSLRTILLNVIRATSLLSFPAMGFLMGCSGPLLAYVFKPEYVQVAAPFSILCLVMFLRIQAIILASIYMALGQPHLQRIFVAVRAACLVVLIVPCIHYGGLAGASLAVLAAEGIGFVAQLYQIRKPLLLRLSDFLDPYLNGFFMMAVLIVFLSLLILFVPGPLWLYLTAGLILLIPMYIATLISTARFFMARMHV